MKLGKANAAIITGSLIVTWLSLSDLLWAASPSAAGQQPATAAAPADDPDDRIVANYQRDCGGQATKNASCDKLGNDFVAILKEDLWTLGSTADRKYIPDIVRFFRKRPEVELRIDAAHAIGMIGPEDSDVKILAPLTNDPVPDVRHAVSNMLTQGKGNAISLLKQRAVPMRNGQTPDKPSDAAKFSMPVAPDSVYLFDSSDATKGRLSYVARGKSDPAQFFKAKAKKGPFKLDQFKEQYRYQLQDDDEALNQLQQAAGKQLENEKPPDPTNLQAFTDYMQRMQAVSMQGSMGRAYFDNYQPNLYGAPTVYILEERQIGKRTYPTRYVVLYQELAFKRPGYRLSWMTVSDDLIKTAQATSLAEEKEELANRAESEAVKKKQAELDSLTKKKDAAEKKQFKKGQADLEKELGF